MEMTDKFSHELEANRKRLRLHCRTLAQTREDAEDLEQQTFLRAWAARESYGWDKPISNWLIRIAVNLNLDRKRMISRRVPVCSYEDAPSEGVEFIDIVPDPAPPIDEILVYREELQGHLSAVQEITPPRDHVLIREVLTGKSNVEIAAIMGSTPLAVRHRSHRLHRRLAGTL
jgi:RNA polymerase sigma-70 factor, ECF subfamily